MSTASLSIERLQRALQLAEQIEQLEREFQAVMNGENGAHVGGFRVSQKNPGPNTATRSLVESSAPVRTTRKKKRVLSPEAKAKIAAAQKARWAKPQGASTGPATAVVLKEEKSAKEAEAKPVKKKPLISKEVLARMAAKAKELKGK